MAEYSLIGVYKIVPTESSIILATNYHKYSFLLDSQGKYEDEIVWENFRNLALVELQIWGDYSPLDLIEISHGDQAPYMEFYLNPTGLDAIEEEATINTDGRRVCFYVHFVDLSEPLQVKGMKIKLQPFSTLPDRLVPFAHYIPTD